MKILCGLKCRKIPTRVCEVVNVYGAIDKKRVYYPKVLGMVNPESAVGTVVVFLWL